METRAAVTPAARSARILGLVLAAGAGTRFGGGKLLAPLAGRPILQHVLDRAAEGGLAGPLVVVPPDDGDLGIAIDWGDARRVVNPDPSRGLASSLQVGWTAALAAAGPPDAIVILLGDQPRVPLDVVTRLVAAPLDAERPLVVPRYRGDGGGNPVRLDVTASALVSEAAGDRGLGPIIDRHPELVRWIDVDGTNPDVDTLADLQRLGGT